MTPEVITVHSHIRDDGSEYITVDGFPDCIAVDDRILVTAKPEQLWVDERGFLNFRAENGWATYSLANRDIYLHSSTYVRASSHIDAEVTA